MFIISTSISNIIRIDLVKMKHCQLTIEGRKSEQRLWFPNIKELTRNTEIHFHQLDNLPGLLCNILTPKESTYDIVEGCFSSSYFSLVDPNYAFQNHAEQIRFLFQQSFKHSGLFKVSSKFSILKIGSHHSYIVIFMISVTAFGKLLLRGLIFLYNCHKEHNCHWCMISE